jgi:membrane fusion protein (multidrug efflux system)
MEVDRPDNADAPEPGAAEGLFREDALRHHLGEGDEGDVIRLSPGWTRWTYLFLVGIVLVGLVFLFVGTTPVYEGGPAVLTVADRTQVSSPAAGTVEAVDVAAGQRVRAGDPLVSFRAAEERAELARTEREWEQHLLERIRDPGDERAAQELMRIRSLRELLLDRLDQRRLRAPRDGVILDVRTRPGQYLEQGDPVLSLVPERPGYTVVAFLPGHALPHLDEAKRIRVDIRGFPEADVVATVEMVGAQVIGPSEARRAVSPDIADTLELAGPVVLVRGRLESDRFRIGDDEYRLHDGMRARADVRVRDEALLYWLMPSLKRLRRGGRA